MHPRDKRIAINVIKQLAELDPLKQAVWILHNMGLTSTDVQKLMKNTFKQLPDHFKVAVVNALRDIEVSGKVLESIKLPVQH